MTISLQKIVLYLNST